jgi:hypothetical protein
MEIIDVCNQLSKVWDFCDILISTVVSNTFVGLVKVGRPNFEVALVVAVADGEFETHQTAIIQWQTIKSSENSSGVTVAMMVRPVQKTILTRKHAD